MAHHCRRAVLQGLLLGGFCSGFGAGCSDLLTEPFRYGTVEVAAVRRTGDPVPGVHLTLYTGTRDLGYGTTDARGRFVFRFVPEALVGMLAAPPEGYRPLDLDRGYNASWRMGEGATEAIEFIYLKFGSGSVGVRAEEATGGGIPDVELVLYSPTGTVAEGVTGPDGDLVFADVPFGHYGVRAYPPRPFTLAGGDAFGVADGLLIDEGYHEAVRFTLERCQGSLGIQAVDIAGSPVPGIRLFLYTPEQIVGEARTNEQGLHRFTDLGCGDYGVQIERAPGWLLVGGSTVWLVDGIRIANGEERTVLLRFQRCEGRVSARVTDTFGQPVPGAGIDLYRADGITAEGVSDAAGVVSFSRVPCHPGYGVRVRPPPGYSVEDGRGRSYFDGISVVEGGEATVAFTMRRN